jgi:hypothetical protein
MPYHEPHDAPYQAPGEGPAQHMHREHSHVQASTLLHHDTVQGADIVVPTLALVAIVNRNVQDVPGVSCARQVHEGFLDTNPLGFSPEGLLGSDNSPWLCTTTQTHSVVEYVWECECGHVSSVTYGKR